MSSSKPYRRHRARGGVADVGEGVAALRELNERAADTPQAAPRAAPDPPPEPRPAPRQTPRLPPRWWSFRGRSRGAIAARLCLLLFGGFLVWAGAGFWAIWRAASDAGRGVTPAARAALADPGGGLLSTAQNTLVIGSDARRGQTRARADTMMIMRTDPDSGHVRFLSIPRDMRVVLPRYGHEKINQAFRLLGQRGAIRAVQRYTGIPIHHIVVVRFGGLPKVVDAVGGIDVTNPVALNCGYPGGTTQHFDKGRLHLDGERALIYSRVRYNCGDDFARMDRQQQIVAALKSKIVAPLSLPFAPWRGAALVRSVTTDLGPVDLVKMGWLQAKLKNDPKADRMRLVGGTQTIGGESFVIPDDSANEEIVLRFVGRS